MNRLLLSILFVSIFFFMNQARAVSNVQVRSVSADFVQEKNMAILARPLISRGRFLFRAPDSLRWEYFSPLSSVLLMNDGRLRKFVEVENEFEEEQGMGIESMRIVLEEISGWLDGEIKDTPTFMAEQISPMAIKLTPRKEAIAAIISEIVLELLDEKGLLKSVTIREGDDSYTRMLFSGGVLNEPIAPNLFTTP